MLPIDSNWTRATGQPPDEKHLRDKTVAESAALHVLVVDDEPLICWSLAEMLSESGNAVTEADSSDAAVRALMDISGRVDVVLLDYQLPDSHHLDLLCTVKRIAPQARIVLMSADVTAEMVRDAMALGACMVVSKPIEMAAVPELVREVACSRPH